MAGWCSSSALWTAPTRWIEDDGTRWVRVVDYKTGTKKLDLREVYCGLDCQMLPTCSA